MVIRIHALGTLRVERDGRVQERLPAQRVRCALLLYLAIERETTRDRVMGLFWPDRPPDRARHLLSQTLYELRQDLGSDWITATGEQLVVNDTLWSDVVAFGDAVDAGDFDAAIEWYAGPLLGGGALAPTREVEGWLERQQAVLTRLHRQARRGAIDARVEDGRLEEALAVARAWVELDPLDEDAQHRLIELMAATGDRSGALRQYERYARLVESELELEPLEETRDLVERIRDGQVGQRTAPSATALHPDEAERFYAAIATMPSSPPADLEPSGGRDDPGAVPVGVESRRPRWKRAVPALLALLAVLIVVGLLFAWRSDAGLEVAAASEVDELDPRRIAVLYFQDLSTEQDLGYLAAGFTEALIHELSQVEELEVLSRTAVASYRDMNGSRYASIIADLSPGTLVEGSVLRVGSQLRLTVQLIDGGTGHHLMSRELYKPVDSLTALLDVLPREAAILLRRRLGTEVELRDSRRGTNSSEAWALVHRGGQILTDARHIRRRDREAGLVVLNRADSLLVRARELDPDWPEPLLRRAGLEEQRALITSDVPSHFEPGATATALAHLDTVLQRWPEHAEALAQRGTLKYRLAESGFGEDPLVLYRDAESDLRRAVLLDGRLTGAWWGLSELLYRQGDYAEAMRAGEQAFRTDAFLSYDAGNLFHLFVVAFNAEDHVEARSRCRDLVDRHPGTMHAPYCELILMTSSPGVAPDVDRARLLADSIVATASASTREIYRQIMDLYLARVMVRAGMADHARVLLQNAAPDGVPGYAAYDVAHVRLLLGDEEGALDALRTYVAAFPGRAQSLDDDWWFRPLHGDARFERILGIGPG